MGKSNKCVNTRNIKIATFLGKAMTYGMVLFLCLKSPILVGENLPKSIETVSDEVAPEPKKVALTYDDGPHPTYTKQVLEVLKEKEAPATFFLIGKSAEELTEIVAEISDEGHTIGNHTYSHCDLCNLSDSECREELETTSQIIQKITGTLPDYVRAPFGNCPNSDELKSYIEVGWTVDTLDWTGISTEAIIEKVKKQVKDKGIILMHDQYPATVEATAQIIDWLRASGYEIVTLDEILFGY